VSFSGINAHHNMGTCLGLVSRGQQRSAQTSSIRTQLNSARHRQEEEEEEDFTSSANQLGCTDVPGLSVTWSNTSVLSVYHV
jgi:hypothetical protein